MNEQLEVNLYGDSLLRGTIIDEKMRYHSTISDILQGFAARYGVIFKNRARFGSTVGRGKGILQKDVDEGLRCKYALVEFGGNDCSFEWEHVANKPDDVHNPATEPAQFEATMLTMVDTLKEKGITPVLMTLPPLDAERHLSFISKTDLARRNILKWLGDAQMIYRFHELYSKIVERIAKQSKTLLVDVRERFLERHDLRKLIGIDGVHLNEDGYKLVAETFADFIETRRKLGRVPKVELCRLRGIF